ncbi:MAG: SDR family NAD(P)-dependent oxidoreductase [Deltaproteobacteria bacterium]|jgi:3-oxoacyl-(acyl-carrier-protein) synthase/NAD(P)-dependent dehydrogenase (short-subunit alcohol dehydrogenase family)/acyl carrier protein|nr:SDR family NAD(P)-dependent oxidoreductase [Deltaproteobacteria bacterium]
MRDEFQTHPDSPEGLNRAVAVIGLGALFPGRPGLEGFWSTVKYGHNTISDVPPDHFNPYDYFDSDPKAKDKMYCRRGAFLSPVPFEPLKFGITPRDLESIDSTQLLSLIVADAALNDAGYPADRTDHSRTAVLMGVTGGLEMLGHMSGRMVYPMVRRALESSGIDRATVSKCLARFGEEFAPWREGSFPGLLGNVTAGRVANRLNLGGANMVVDAACASSLAAVGQAVLELRSGRSDLVVTGGVDTFTDAFMFTCFCKTPALSPTEDIRSFDQAGDGTMLGEGLGVIILKRLPEALKDRDRIYAVIRGVGGASDGKGTAIFAPSAHGQLRAMEAAFKEADLSPATVELVEGHGTGTPAGDAAEVAALGQLYGTHRPGRLNEPWCALGSIKAQIGHTKSAAGMAGLIKVILSLYHKVLPPSIKVKNPLAPLTAPDSPCYVNNQARPWLARAEHPRRAAVSAFGFGGSNFHCLVEEGPAPKPLAETGQHLIPLSGPDPQSLSGILNELSWAEDPGALDVRVKNLYASFQPEAMVRLAVAGPFEEIVSIWPDIKRCLSAVQKGRAAHWPQGVFYSAEYEEKPLRLLLGPQTVSPNLGRELALAFPSFQNVLDLAGRLSPNRLGQVLFPPELASPEAKLHWSELLNASPYLGPILTLALGAVWTSFGLTFDSVTCLGSGLIAGAYMAGCLKLADAVRLAAGFNEKKGAGLKSHLAKTAESLDISNPKTHLWADGLEIKTKDELIKSLLNLQTKNAAAADSKSEIIKSLTAENNDLLVIGRTLTHSDSPNILRPDDSWSPNSLARCLAKLSARGLRPDLHQWPTAPAPPAKPQSHFVNLSGANYYTAQRALARKPAPALEPAAPIPADSDTSGLFRQMIALQTETVRAIKDLVSELKVSGASGSAARSQGSDRETVRNIRPAPALPQSGSFIRPQDPPPAVTASDSIWPDLSAILARETGYPAEALNEGMDLEEDLGLDSIKRMELLAALADRFPSLHSSQNLPRTLGQLAEQCASGFVSPQAAPASLTEAKAAPEPAAEDAPADLGSVLLEVLAQETGYPADSLKPEMDLESDLGLDSIKRVEILSVLADRLPGLDLASLSGAATLGELASELNKLKKTAAPDSARQEPSSEAGRAFEAQEERSADLTSSADPAGDVYLVVARETGYPAELLKPDMDLEGDLGLDSIKKVEILSVLAESYPDLSADDQSSLAGAQTLGDWLNLFEAKAPPLNLSRKAPVSQRPGSKLPAPGPAGYKPRSDGPEAVSPDPKVRKVSPGNGRSRSSGNGRALLDQALSSQEPPSLFQVEALVTAPETGPGRWPATGKIRLVGTDNLTRSLEQELRDRGYATERSSWYYDFEKWRGESPADILFLVWPGPDKNARIITQALKALETCGPNLKAAVGLSFLGGTFGFPGSNGQGLPTVSTNSGNTGSGALVGLMKCAAREWPEVATRILDLPLSVYDMPSEGWLKWILENAASPGPVELGLKSENRLVSLTLKPYLPQESPEPLLDRGDTMVVTGGGRGVTAAVLLEMARLYRPRLVILGRTPLGPAEPPWLAELTLDKDIKAALHKAADFKLTPLELNERTRLILSTRELRRNLDLLTETGATVEYLPGDYTRREVIENTARQIMARFGPVRGFIHGAGILADHPILGKKQEDFARVYATKAQMAENLLKSFNSQTLKLVVFFSSSTARFGRQGQSDYAAGNEVLNKTAWELALVNPQARVLAVNWGPWAGGMVTESLAGQFQAQGVGLIGLKEGAETFVRLIRSPAGDPAEVVVLGQGTNLEALAAYTRGGPA